VVIFQLRINLTQRVLIDNEEQLKKEKLPAFNIFIKVIFQDLKKLFENFYYLKNYLP
jgi:hypothetical protein